MGNKRTFTAKVAGTEYEIPTTMGVLSEAEEASGISLMSALAENRFGRFLQGALYAGLVRLKVNEIDGKPLTYELIDEAVDFAEAQSNYIAFLQAMSPDTEPSPKNEVTEPQAKNSRGKESSTTPTVSSD